jgi:hypothetical protein
LEAHILRSEGRDNFKFCFWQFLVNLNKCAKFYQNLSRCLPGAGQACADLPVFVIEYINFCVQISVWNRKTLLFYPLLLLCESRKIYVGNPCLNVSEERMGGSSRAVVDYLLHPSFISGICARHRT